MSDKKPYRNIELVPAYGRDYNSKKEVVEAWKSGIVDFKVEDFRHRGYVSGSNDEIVELQSTGVTHVHIRYKKLTQVAVIPL